MKKVLMVITILLLVITTENLFQEWGMYQFFGNRFSFWSVFLVWAVAAVLVWFLCWLIVRLFPGWKIINWGEFFAKN
jgi:hypothetical protein